MLGFSFKETAQLRSQPMPHSRRRWGACLCTQLRRTGCSISERDDNQQALDRLSVCPAAEASVAHRQSSAGMIGWTRRHEGKSPVSDDLRRDTGQRPANLASIGDHSANERTLLAWVRTCIAIMALGFVVARSGLLIRALGLQAPRQTPIWPATAFGVTFVAWGSALVALATLRYRSTSRAIDRGDYTPSPVLILLLTCGVLMVAVLLAVYLLITT
jgi:putative membrane protein